MERLATISKPNIPLSGYQGGAISKTLAYAQALQYLAEKSNPPMPGQPCLLVGCVLELSRAMEPYVAFSNDAILEGAAPWERSLEGQTRATIPRMTQLAPAKVPIEETAPMEELAPAEVPTEEAALIQEPTEEVPPWRSPLMRWPHRGAH